MPVPFFYVSFSSFFLKKKVKKRIVQRKRAGSSNFGFQFCASTIAGVNLRVVDWLLV